MGLTFTRKMKKIVLVQGHCCAFFIKCKYVTADKEEAEADLTQRGRLKNQSWGENTFLKVTADTIKGKCCPPKPWLEQRFIFICNFTASQHGQEKAAETRFLEIERLPLRPVWAAHEREALLGESCRRPSSRARQPLTLRLDSWRRTECKARVEQGTKKNPKHQTSLSWIRFIFYTCNCKLSQKAHLHFFSL